MIRTLGVIFFQFNKKVLGGIFRTLCAITVLLSQCSITSAADSDSEFTDSASRKNQSTPTIKTEMNNGRSSRLVEAASRIQEGSNEYSKLNFEKAIENAKTSLNIFDELLNSSDSDIDVFAKMAKANLLLGKIKNATGQDQEAFSCFEKSFKYYDLALNKKPSIDNLKNKVDVLSILADIKSSSGDYQESLRFYETALADCDKLKEVENSSISFFKANILDKIGNLKLKMADKKGLEYLKRALVAVEDSKDNPNYVSLKAKIYLNLGRQQKSESSVEALKLFDDAVQLSNSLIDRFPTAASHYELNGDILAQIGFLKKKQNSSKKELEYFSRSIERYKESLTKMSENGMELEAKALTVRKLGNLLIAANKKLEALKQFELADRMYDKIVLKSPNAVFALIAKGKTLTYESHIYRDLGNDPLSKQCLQNSIRQFDKAFQLAPNNIDLLRSHGRTSLILGKLYFSLKDFESANIHFAKAINSFSKVLEKAPNDVLSIIEVGNAYENLSKLETRKEKEKTTANIEKALSLYETAESLANVNLEAAEAREFLVNSCLNLKRRLEQLR